MKKSVDKVLGLWYTYIIKRGRYEVMRRIKVEKLGRNWYVRVFDGEQLMTQASFTTKKVAEACRAHWLEAKTFGDARAD